MVPTTVIENLRFFAGACGSGRSCVVVSPDCDPSTGAGADCVEVVPMTLLLSPQEKQLGGSRAMETFTESIPPQEGEGVLYLELFSRENVMNE